MISMELVEPNKKLVYDKLGEFAEQLDRHCGDDEPIDTMVAFAKHDAGIDAVVVAETTEKLSRHLAIFALRLGIEQELLADLMSAVITEQNQQCSRDELIEALEDDDDDEEKY